MSNLTFKNSHKEDGETTVHTPTHEVCKYFQAQSYAYYSAKVKYRSQEEEAFLSALALWGLPSHWIIILHMGYDLFSQENARLNSTENEESRKYFEQIREDPFPFCLIIQAEGMLKPFLSPSDPSQEEMSLYLFWQWITEISLFPYSIFFLCFCSL